MTCKEYESLTLLSYLAGDLSSDRGAAVEQHLTHCAECSGYIAAMEKERDDFLEAYPEVPTVKTEPKKILLFRSYKPLLSAAAVLVIALGVGSLLTRRLPETTWRTKGNVALALYVSDSSGHASVREGMAFYPGERIQFTYSCGKERFFILASLDETGKLSVFYPTTGDSSLLLEPGSDLPLPHSIRLDDYIGIERYFAVFSEQPLSVKVVTEGIQKDIRRAGKLETSQITLPGATVRSVVINKKEVGVP